MAPKATTRIISIHLPPLERERVAQLANRLGASRSKLLRAGFAAIEDEDEETVVARLAALPDRRRTG